MNDLDDQLRDAFAARADTTSVEHRTDFGSSVAAAAPSKSWKPIMAVAAVTVAVMVAGLALITRSPADEQVPATVPPPAPTTLETTPPPADLGSGPLLPPSTSTATTTEPQLVSTPTDFVDIDLGISTASESSEPTIRYRADFDDGAYGLGLDLSNGLAEGPAGFGVDDTGTVYIVDGVNHRIIVSHLDGTTDAMPLPTQLADEWIAGFTVAPDATQYVSTRDGVYVISDDTVIGNFAYSELGVAGPLLELRATSDGLYVPNGESWTLAVTAGPRPAPATNAALPDVSPPDFSLIRSTPEPSGLRIWELGATQGFRLISQPQVQGVYSTSRLQTGELVLVLRSSSAETPDNTQIVVIDTDSGAFVHEFVAVPSENMVQNGMYVRIVGDQVYFEVGDSAGVSILQFDLPPGAPALSNELDGGLSLGFTFEGIDGLVAVGEPQIVSVPLQDETHNETTTLWESTGGLTDGYLTLREFTSNATEPEGDTTFTPLDVPVGRAWLGVDNVDSGPPPSSAIGIFWLYDDGHAWSVRNYGLTPERLAQLALDIVTAPDGSHTLRDPSMTLIGTADFNTQESIAQQWNLGGHNLSLGVSNGGLARQLSGFAVHGIVERTIAGHPGYEVTLSNGQVNLIWPTDRPGWWASVSSGPGLAVRAEVLAEAVVST